MRAHLAAVLALIAVPIGVARADDDLARAKQLEGQLEYDKALAVVDAALARGGAEPARLVELHLLAGRLAGGLERARAAEGHFAIVLALRPDTALPEGTSPKLTAPFTAARARTSPLEIRVTTVRGVVTLLPVRDALRIVRGISLRVSDPSGQWRELVDRNALRLAVPAGMTATDVAALDAAGNQLWTGTAPLEKAEPGPPSPNGAPSNGSPSNGSPSNGSPSNGAPPNAASSSGSASNPHAVVDDAPRPAFHARWSTWAVITGVALASGGVAAWRFHVAQQLWDDARAHTPPPDYSRLTALEDRGRRWGLAANLSFGAAAVTGAATLVLWLRRPGEPRVVAVPGPGPSLTAMLRF